MIMEKQNETKAKELATNLMGGDDRNIQPIIDCMIEAMAWKENQLIDKAVEWLNKYLFYLDKKDDIIDNFKQVMKGK